ncbi:MAG: LysM domain-containing protein, partial [Bacillota bacterium]
TYNPVPTPPPQNPPARSGRIVYYVQPGDTLWAISVRYGVPVYRLIEFNPETNANALWVGQIIIIRDGGNIWVPTPGNSGGYGAPSGNRVHIVEPGDTLWQIALRYNASIRAIMDANGITDANTLWVGQRLVIP